MLIAYKIGPWLWLSIERGKWSFDKTANYQTEDDPSENSFQVDWLSQILDLPKTIFACKHSSLFCCHMSEEETSFMTFTTEACDQAILKGEVSLYCLTGLD